MNKKIYFMFSLILFLVILMLQSTSASITIQTITSTTFGKLRLSIFDESNQPIYMAKIFVKETNGQFNSGKLGECELTLPTNKTNQFSNAPTWTEYTIVIDKNGFIPHILYGAKVKQNITRTGIVITLHEITPNQEYIFTTSYDFPEESYSTNIINKYTNKK